MSVNKRKNLFTLIIELCCYRFMCKTRKLAGFEGRRAHECQLCHCFLMDLAKMVLPMRVPIHPHSPFFGTSVHHRQIVTSMVSRYFSKFNASHRPDEAGLVWSSSVNDCSYVVSAIKLQLLIWT